MANPLSLADRIAALEADAKLKDEVINRLLADSATKDRLLVEMSAQMTAMSALNKVAGWALAIVKVVTPIAAVVIAAATFWGKKT